MKRTIDAGPDNATRYAAAIAEVDNPAWLAAGMLQRDDWGSLWTATGPGLPGSPRTADKVSVSFAGRPVIESVRPAAQRTVVFDVEGVDGSPGATMSVLLDGTGVARVADIDMVVNGESVRDDWCLGDCTCPDGQPTFPTERVLDRSTTVTASLVGLPDSGSSALVEVNVFDPDTYDCENPNLGGVDDSLLGTWRANPQSVAGMFAEASAFGASALPIDVAGATGSVLMTFAEGGVGELEYQDVSVFLNDEALGELTFKGTGAFAWGVTDGQILIDGTTFAVQVSSDAIGVPLVITDDDVPAAGVTKLTASVVGDDMTITASEGSAGDVFFPISWTRVDG